MAEFVYRYVSEYEDLLGVTKFASGLWRSPCVIVSTSADYDGVLEPGPVSGPVLQTYRCLRTDFEAACAALGFDIGGAAGIQGDDHRLVAVSSVLSSTTCDLQMSTARVYDTRALPPSFLAMWEHVGTCGVKISLPSSPDVPEWCAAIIRWLQVFAPNPDVALAATWCVRELRVLCSAGPGFGTAFASPHGRVVLQWVVELLRLDAIAHTLTENVASAAIAINDCIQDLRLSNPGITHDPTGCFVVFDHGPSSTALETFMRDGV